MNVRRLITAAALSAIVAVAAGTGSASAKPPPGGCGNGFELRFDPSLEAFLSGQTQGNVNGDGFVCFKFTGQGARPAGMGQSIVVDNRVQGNG